MLAAFNRPGPVLTFIAIALILDQAIKYAVEIYLPMHELIPVILLQCRRRRIPAMGYAFFYARCLPAHSTASLIPSPTNSPPIKRLSQAPNRVDKRTLRLA